MNDGDVSSPDFLNFDALGEREKRERVNELVCRVSDTASTEVLLSVVNSETAGETGTESGERGEGGALVLAFIWVAGARRMRSFHVPASLAERCISAGIGRTSLFGVCVCVRDPSSSSYRFVSTIAVRGAGACLPKYCACGSVGVGSGGVSGLRGVIGERPPALRCDESVLLDAEADAVTERSLSLVRVRGRVSG